MTVPSQTRRSLLLGGVLAAALAPQASSAAAAPALQERLAGLRRFIGRWRGEGEGEPGSSRVRRSYEVVLGGQFLLARNTSTYAPQPRNPRGEVHDDLGLFSFDTARQRAVLRQFHVEGFVNQYVATVATLDGEVLSLESEATENVPGGWRARETYAFSGVDVFVETFELAESGKDFAPYSRNRLRRV